MMVKQIKAIGSDGLEYTIHVVNTMVDAGTLQNPNAQVVGLNLLQLDDGSNVLRITDGTFVVENTGIDLTPI